MEQIKIEDENRNLKKENAKLREAFDDIINAINCSLLGYKDIEEVRIGKFIEIETKSNEKTKLNKEIDEICDKLLANPNIEQYTFKID